MRPVGAMPRRAPGLRAERGRLRRPHNDQFGDGRTVRSIGPSGYTPESRRDLRRRADRQGRGQARREFEAAATKPSSYPYSSTARRLHRPRFTEIDQSKTKLHAVVIPGEDLAIDSDKLLNSIERGQPRNRML